MVSRAARTGSVSRTPPIPADEMLLAEAIAAAKARGLKWCRGSAFENAIGHQATRSTATNCCALGALALVGAVSDRQALNPVQRDVGSLNTGHVFYGNDFPERWTHGEGWLAGDKGESLGWAFRCAMEET
jgi:hypothetical protein